MWSSFLLRDIHPTIGPAGQSLQPRGGRTWWAHRAITRMNIGPIILRNQIEALMNIQGIGEKRFLELRPQIVVRQGQRLRMGDYVD